MGNKLILGVNDLLTVNPELASEWHPTKNEDLKPEDVSFGSHKKVWWKCNNGHEWQADIHSRVAGNGCPYCKGKKIRQSLMKVKPGNSLLEKYPRIASLWHPDKNGLITPSMVNSGSNYKYWWRCELGHEWESSVSNVRLSHGNCPVCMKELGTSFPEQALFYYLSKHFSCINREIINGKEIDIYIPDKKIGIEYNGYYYHKNRKDIDDRKEQTLKECGISLLIILESDTDSVEGNVITVTKSSSSKQFDIHLKWVIESLLQLLGETVNGTEVDIDRDSLLIYSQYIFSRKKNSLSVIFPSIAKEWDYSHNGNLTPEMVTPGSQKVVWWNCKNGHAYKAAINSRIRYYKDGSNFGCPYCSGHKVLKGFNDLLTLNHSLAKEWNYEKNAPLLPSDVTTGSKKKVWWKCQKCGNEWVSTVSNRNMGRGCPSCKTDTISKKLAMRNTDSINLFTQFPEIASEWNDTKNGDNSPDQFAPHSNKKVWWKCNICSYEWEASINNRVNGCGCPSCSRKRNGLRSRMSNEDFLFKMQRKGNPDVILLSEYETNRSTILCKCSICGNEWITTPRCLLNGSGCPKCRVNRRSKL